MTDEKPDNMPWMPAGMAEQWQQASEEAVDRQIDMFREMLGTTGPNQMGDLSQFSQFGMGAATFKARVQSGGRVSIPDAEREALDIEEGDIVQTIIVPVKRDRSTAEE